MMEIVVIGFDEDETWRNLNFQYLPV